MTPLAAEAHRTRFLWVQQPLAGVEKTEVGTSKMPEGIQKLKSL